MPLGVGWAASNTGCWRSLAPIQRRSSVTARIQYMVAYLSFRQGVFT